MNFTRGFRQWEFTRGKQQDRWKSVFAADRARMARTQDADDAHLYGIPRYHIANTDGRMSVETCCTGRSTLAQNYGYMVIRSPMLPAK